MPNLRRIRITGLMDTRDPFTHWKAYLSKSNRRTAARTNGLERYSRARLIERIRDLEQNQALLSQALRQLEVLHGGSPIPALTWRRVRDDFVLVDFNPAAEAYLGEAACPSIGDRAAALLGRRSKAFSTMDDCFRRKTVIEVEGAPGRFTWKRRQNVLTSFAFVPPDMVMAHVKTARPEIVIKKELEAVETKYRTLFDYNPIQTIVVDRDGRIRDYNLAKKEAKDRLPATGDIMFRDYAGKYPPDTNMHAELMDCIERQVSKTFDAVSYGDKFFSVTIAPLPDGAIIAALDVTRLKNAEREVRKLSEKIIRSEENDRREISWLLHDELIQELAGLKMSVDSLALKNGRSEEDVLKALKDLSKRIGNAIKTTRSVSQRLHPALLDRFGLVTVVREMCSEFEERNHCWVDFSANGVDGRDLPPGLAITLYRIIAESFRNIRKHAHANHVIVRLSVISGLVHLLIQDDGAGFDQDRQALDASRGKHLGLSIMQERMALLKGEMEIKSEPGEGTWLRFRFPLKESPREQKEKASTC